MTFVEGFVSASSKCTHICHASKKAFVKAMASVLASATSKAIKHQCTGPDSYFTYHQIEVVIVEASITALAKLISQATVPNPGSCVIDLKSGVSVIPSSPAHGLDPHVPHPSPYKPSRPSKKARRSAKSGKPTKKGRRHGRKGNKRSGKKGGSKRRHGKKGRGRRSL